MNPMSLIVIFGVFVVTWAGSMLAVAQAERKRRRARERHEDADFALPTLTPAEARHLKRGPRLHEDESCYLQVRNHEGERTTIHVRADGSMVRYWSGGSVLLNERYSKGRAIAV